MTWTLRTRGAHSQPCMQDFLCDTCGPISALAPRDVDGIPCPDGCGGIAVWVISAPMVGPEKASVDRGPVQSAENPKWLDTRKLGRGEQTISEFKADRARRMQEWRHRERKEDR